MIMKMPVYLCFLLSFNQLAFSGEIQAGVAKVDITPPLGISLTGTISQNPPAGSIHDPLHIRAIVLNDGRTTLAIAIVDNTMISAPVIDEAKNLIKKQSGIPGANIIVAATHTHSTPRAVVGLIDEDSHRDYLKFLSKKIAIAILQAQKSAVPAGIGWASFNAPEHVHNRRWFVEESAQIPNPFGETGEVVKMNPGRKGLVKAAGPVDPQVFLLSIQTAEGMPRALLANYGLHYVGGVGGGRISADYFGVFSESVGKKLKTTDDGQFLGIMSNGTSGDVNNVDFGSPRTAKREPFEKISEVAEDLASRAAPVVKAIKYQSDLQLAATESVLHLKIRKPDATRIKWAEENQPPKGMKLRPNRIQIYAREALELAKYPEEAEVRIQAFRIGELAIVSIPCEVFAETGLAIKKDSPFPGNTFTIELANGYHGYLPTAQQHQWGGYETWPARSAHLETSAEGKIRREALRLLSELKKK